MFNYVYNKNKNKMDIIGYEGKYKIYEDGVINIINL